jgi:hypothetical protein
VLPALNDAGLVISYALFTSTPEGIMKRVTILFDDESLYRAVKAEAARDGRPVKNAVSEALRAWLAGRTGLTAEERKHGLAALQDLDEMRSRQPVHAIVEDSLEDLQAERS